MATRAMRASSNDHVQALNLIEVLFDGNSQKDKDVRKAWQIYLDFFQQIPPDGEENARAHNEKGIDFLVNLLESMAKYLRYDFDKIQLKRGVYYPRGHSDESDARRVILDSLAKMLAGGKPLPMAVVSFPFSEEALRNQTQVQEALLRTLSGEQPLRVKPEG